MDVRNGSIPVPNRNPTSAERFLGVLSQAPPASNFNNSFTESSSGVGVQERDDSELDEDDVFWTGDFAVESNHRNHSNLPSSFSSNSRPHVHQHLPGFSQPEAFGILAALPENETGPSSLRNGSHFYHKTSVSSSSSSSSSSSRMIPSFPKPPLDRSSVPNSSFSLKYQSAPVNVPMLSKGVHKNGEFDEIDDNDEEVDIELLPPHEIVARSLAHSPALACSVLEGAGRTLKGRDLRRVRNAVFRRTVDPFCCLKASVAVSINPQADCRMTCWNMDGHEVTSFKSKQNYQLAEIVDNNAVDGSTLGHTLSPKKEVINSSLNGTNARVLHKLTLLSMASLNVITALLSSGGTNLMP